MASKVPVLLTALKEERGWNYFQLAKFLGVKKTVAWQWATNAVDPQLGSLRKIAKKLGVTVGELVS